MNAMGGSWGKFCVGGSCRVNPGPLPRCVGSVGPSPCPCRRVRFRTNLIERPVPSFEIGGRAVPIRGASIRVVPTPGQASGRPTTPLLLAGLELRGDVDADPSQSPVNPRPVPS